jgi:hypothetical protein
MEINTESKTLFVRFEVFTAASIKMTVFMVVAPCSLVEVYRRFRDSCSLHHQGDGNFCQTTQRNNPEDSRYVKTLFV